MKQVLWMILCGVVACTAMGAHASEESYVSWNRVRIESNGDPVTGMIRFEAGVDGEMWKSVRAFAFGRTYDLSTGQVARLRGYPLNSLVITHEAGYKELGGHTVHFKLSRQYYEKKLLREKRLYISISKGKGLEIHEPEMRR